MWDKKKKSGNGNGNGNGKKGDECLKMIKNNMFASEISYFKSEIMIEREIKCIFVSMYLI